ncbi:hypothetical protein ACJIZ3_022703 [Penstemon smallii]|uniref:Uncharacterized protein n=1 Tax=Penstemon smallii TaxID=265156 RepID=A0ABD3TLZ7_9LAMI
MVISNGLATNLNFLNINFFPTLTIIIILIIIIIILII